MLMGKKGLNENSYGQNQNPQMMPDNTQTTADNVQNNANPMPMPASTMATLDPNNQYVQQHQALFTQAFAQPADFMNRFKLVMVGCGSDCFHLYALDKQTGEAYIVQDHDDRAQEPFQDYSVNGNEIDVTNNAGQKIVFVWNEQLKEFLVK